MNEQLKLDVEAAERDLNLPLLSARSLHPRLYTGEDVYAVEMEALFRRNWLSVARSSEVPEPGDWKVFEIMNQKVLLVRGRDRVLRAFSPACRHKWALVAQGCGHSATLVCPYHKWTYDLNGQLRGAPYLNLADMAPEQRQLHAYACEEWLGWAFVNFDSNAPPMGPRLADIEEVARPWRVSELVPMFEPLRFDGAFNWKTLCDNVGESYHVAGTHPVSILPYADVEASRWRTDGELWCRSDVPGYQRRPQGFVGPSLSSSVEEFSGTWTYNVYPTHVFGLVEDFVVWQRLDVRGASNLVMDLVVLGAPEALNHPAWKEIEDGMRTSIRDIEMEDQRAFHLSYEGQVQPGALPGSFAQYEEGTWHFQRWWAGAMSRHLAANRGELAR